MLLTNLITTALKIIKLKPPTVVDVERDKQGKAVESGPHSKTPFSAHDEEGRGLFTSRF